MPFLDDILAQVQDEAVKKAIQGLPEGAVKVFEARATLAVEAQTKLQQAEAQIKSNQDELEGLRGLKAQWANFDAQWKGGLEQKVQNLGQIEARMKALEAENVKLKPEAERAAILAKQIEEGGAIDPNKILELGDARYKEKFLSREDADKLVQRAVEESRKQTSFQLMPAGLKLLEYKIKAQHEYGLDVPTEVIAEAVTRSNGDFERAYASLTADKAKELQTKRQQEEQERVKGEIAKAREEGMRLGRQQAETTRILPEDDSLGLAPPPMVPEGQKDKPFNAREYDSSAGTLAKDAYQMYQKLEAEGKLKDLM